MKEKQSVLRMSARIIEVVGLDLNEAGITGWNTFSDRIELQINGRTLIIRHLAGVEDYPASYFVEERINPAITQCNDFTKAFEDKLNGKAF